MWPAFLIWNGVSGGSNDQELNPNFILQNMTAYTLRTSGPLWGKSTNHKGPAMGETSRPFCKTSGGHLNKKTVLPGMAIPMLKIRRPNGRLIFNMEIAIRG